jgi:hypothetical protein
MVGSVKTLVFSLDTVNKQPDADEYNTMIEHLKTGNILVTKTKGSYKGRAENGFICLVTTELQEQMIMGIAHAYKQEAVLEVEMPDSKGYLRFLNGQPRTFAGIWKEAPVDVEGDFTMNTTTMKVYKCY